MRQTERHIRTDPPTAAELAGARRRRRARSSPRPCQRAPRERCAHAIAVAGHRDLAGRDRPAARSLRPGQGARLRAHAQPSATGMLDLLAALPLERRREVTGLHPDRAPTIVAGVVILIEVLRAVRPRRDRGLRARHPARGGARAGAGDRGRWCPLATLGGVSEQRVRGWRARAQRDVGALGADRLRRSRPAHQQAEDLAPEAVAEDRLESGGGDERDQDHVGGGVLAGDQCQDERGASTSRRPCPGRSASAVRARFSAPEPRRDHVLRDVQPRGLSVGPVRTRAQNP